MLDKKDKILYGLTALLLLVLMGAATVFVLRAFNARENANSNNSQIVDTGESADELKAKAEQATQDNQITEAERLYNEAKEKYEEEKNYDEAAEAEAQSYLLTHPSTPPEPIIDEQVGSN
jgi:outer membrane protein assembly factor BamD (BamD/ComL family)